MHRLKHQAKRNAWYGDDEGSYNPFARRRPAPGPGRSSLRADHEESAIPARSYTDDVVIGRSSEVSLPAPLKHAATTPDITVRLDEKAHEDLLTTSRPPSVLASTSNVAYKKGPSLWPFARTKADDADSRPKHQRFTVASQVRATIFGSWLNVLLVFIPVGFAVNYAHLGSQLVFAINFVAIIPSTMMISLAVDELSLRTGEVIGALLNMTFSNATQLISSILLLRSRQIVVLKTSLLGSIISNLLLMLGLCFFCGGVTRLEQHFNMNVAQMVAGMLFLAIISLVVPTASRLMAQGVTDRNIVVQSRGTSIVLLISYGLYLFFQLKTHAEVFNQPSQKVPKKAVFKSRTITSIAQRPKNRPITPPEQNDDDDELEEPQLTIWVAIAVLVVFTVLIGFNAEFATSSIQNMVKKANISQTFVGFVILPILSNDVLSVANAVKDKMDLSISLTLERCMQTALLVVPLVVIIAWGMSVEEMSLDFDGFSVAATFASIIIVTYVIQDGKSNWLVGALLIKVYVIVALAAYFVQS